MNTARLCPVLLFLTFFSACSSGGGGSGSVPQAAWEKFRRDGTNSGAAISEAGANKGNLRSVAIDVPPATPGAISSSPAIAQDGSIYAASEGGTLAVLDGDLNVKARLTSCAGCPGNPPLGPLVSSPAVYTMNDATSVLIGSRSGSVFLFYQSAPDQPLQCMACFRPKVEDFGPPGTTKIAASFASSPNFTTDPVIFTINGIFIGASVDVEQNGSTRSVGKLYAINSTGVLNWQYPPPGAPEIGAVTSSPAIGPGNVWYFTTADGSLYALTSDGALKWKTTIGAASDPTLPFAPSVLTASNFVLSPTANGEILGMSADQLVSFRAASGDASFTASLASGGLPFVTPTPNVPGPPGTPTATPTPGFTTMVYGVTRSGHIIALDVALPTPTLFPTPQTPIPAPVISSPALSTDGFLIFGSIDGRLHIVSTFTGSELLQPPIVLADGVPIRSSPSIAQNGTIYVGADNGLLYAIGLP